MIVVMIASTEGERSDGMTGGTSAGTTAETTTVAISPRRSMIRVAIMATVPTNAPTSTTTATAPRRTTHSTRRPTMPTLPRSILPHSPCTPLHTTTLCPLRQTTRSPRLRASKTSTPSTRTLLHIDMRCLMERRERTGKGQERGRVKTRTHENAPDFSESFRFGRVIHCIQHGYYCHMPRFHQGRDWLRR